MDSAETEKLWTLLSTVWSRSPQIRDTKLRLAWELALEPYAYSDVKAAVAEYMRKNKYFPDMCDILGRLPEVLGGTQERPAAGAQECILRLKERVDKIRERYHEFGIMSPGEALSVGINYERWEREVQKDG